MSENLQIDFLANLKKKPNPEKKQDIKIIMQDPKQPSGLPVLNIKVKLIDDTKKNIIKREDVFQKLRPILNVKKKDFDFIKPDIIQDSKEKQIDDLPKTPNVIKIKKPQNTGKRVVLNITSSKDKESDIDIIPRKRRTKKPLEHIINVIPNKNFKIGKTIINNRIPKRKPNILIKRSEYYMNNREIFVNFINSMFESYKDQIRKDEGQISCDQDPDKAFSLLTHQEIVRDYLNLFTPYRGLLLYHGLGSGKTCSSIAIAEGMKTSKQSYYI